jgi:3-methyl-2-oxobutanoate hydroxymethyltransferase
VDGQLLIISDVIGEFQAFTPKFVKKYCNVAEPITKAIADYSADVKSKAFPLDSHCYHVKKNEEEGIEKVFKEIALKPNCITPLPKDGP